VINYSREYKEYNKSDFELEFCLRINAEWNEESFKKLCGILMLFFETCKKETGIPSEIDYFFSSSINRIIGIISNPLFTENNFVGIDNEDYKKIISQRIDTLKELKSVYEKRLFLKYFFCG
jgi:hypothetical protein